MSLITDGGFAGDVLIVDGLVFFSDGGVETLRAGKIAAINLTVSHFEADFETSCEQLAGWHARLGQPDSPWRLIESAADIASARNVRLAHQCHTTTLFEQVDRSLEVLEKIGRPNFGLIYEPANLMVCGESYGVDTLKKFEKYLMNVYVQNHAIDPAGPDGLETWCLGLRRFRHIPLWEAGGVDFDEVMAALGAVDYNGYFTIHHAQNTQTIENAREYARECAQWFRKSVPTS